MDIYLDTANVDEIRAGLATGVVRGVTTNPSLIAREKKPFAACLAELLNLDPELTVLAEVVADDSDGMVREARQWSALSTNLVIKIPMTPAGLAAVKVLAQEGIRTTVTLVFSLNQAIAASCAGANFVAPFVGRLDDIDAGGVDLIRSLRHTFDLHKADTRILAASVRSPQSVAELFAAGCDIVTMPGKILHAMLGHPLTDLGLKKFMEDWRTVPCPS